MSYPNISDVNLSKDFGVGLLHYANDVSNSWISNMILIGIFIVTLMGYTFYNKDFIEGAAIAGFITAVVGSLFFFAGFVSAPTLLYILGVSILTFALLYFTKKSSR